MDNISAPDTQKNNNRPPFIIRLIATGLFSGYSPVIPGTAGTAVGLIIYAIPGFESIPNIFIFTCVFLILGIYTSSRMERYKGEDPACVVIDEIVGMWVSLIFIPKNILLAILGFIIFRFFDIVKLQPALYVERYRKGIGIMLDDIVSAIYTNITIHLLIWIFPGLIDFKL